MLKYIIAILVLWFLFRVSTKKEEKIESKKIFNEKNLLVIPFEKLTKDPNFFMSEICKRLDMANDKSYQKLYKKLKLPRPSNSIDEDKALKDKIIQNIEKKVNDK